MRPVCPIRDDESRRATSPRRSALRIDARYLASQSRSTSRFNEAQPQVCATVADAELAQLELRQPRGKAPQLREVRRPPRVPRRIVGAEPAEGEQLAREPALGLRGLDARED